MSTTHSHASRPASLITGVVLLLTSVLSFGTAQAADSTATHRSFFATIGSDIAVVWSDVGPYFTAPLHYDGTDWRNTAIVVGGTGVLMPLDSAGRHASLTSSQSASMQDFMNLATHYGDIYAIGGACAVTYLGGLAFGSEDLRVTGRELIETLALAGVTTTVVKYALGRSRPFTGDGSYSFHPFSFNDARFSMPSGHTTVAFAISSVLAARIDHPIATVLLYGAAATTAFSRMYHDKHWLSDTFLGAAIATTTGLWVVHRDERRKNNEASHPLDQSGLEITPSLGGLSLSYHF
ncbi:MAG: phosphatase PAP2 family protein [Bacteroidetes bacterium]|nr:phosphatase PAP2 family protein [Bacteroidota bacterium]